MLAKLGKESILSTATRWSLCLNCFWFELSRENTAHWLHMDLVIVCNSPDRKDFTLSDNYTSLQTSKRDKIRSGRENFFIIIPLPFIVCSSNFRTTALSDEGSMHHCYQLRDAHIGQSFYCALAYLLLQNALD